VATLLQRYFRHQRGHKEREEQAQKLLMHQMERVLQRSELLPTSQQTSFGDQSRSRPQRLFNSSLTLLDSYAALSDLPSNLNFLSDNFDATAALARPNLPIPVTRVRALDNMSKAAMLLPAQQRRVVVPDEKRPSRPPLSATSEVPKSSKLKVHP
jgi:hypothetical protein